METPLRAEEEVQANAAFEALLDATSRPGSIHSLPDVGFSSVITALIDRECTAQATDPLVMAELMRTGARAGAVPDCDHVFCSADEAVEIAAQAQLGSDLYPDDGATLVVRAKLGEGACLRLTGPGIDGQLKIQIDGLPENFWSVRDARIRYPMGFDLLFVDQQNVVAIPRSTKVEAA